jgi:hypothetical protein
MLCSVGSIFCVAAPLLLNKHGHTQPRSTVAYLPARISMSAVAHCVRSYRYEMQTQCVMTSYLFPFDKGLSGETPSRRLKQGLSEYETDTSQAASDGNQCKTTSKGLNSVPQREQALGDSNQCSCFIKLIRR